MYYCTYSSKGEIEKFTFLAKKYSGKLLSYDYVEVHDGGRPDSPLVGRYCGSDLPPVYATSSNQAYIRFRTDYSVTRGGFRIRYEIGTYSHCQIVVCAMYVKLLQHFF